MSHNSFIAKRHPEYAPLDARPVQALFLEDIVVPGAILSIALGYYGVISTKRVFMTRSDLECCHEPFSQAFYHGPERFSPRYKDNAYGDSPTYGTVLEKLESQKGEGKRLFIKDMAYYLSPPDSDQIYLAPSIAKKKLGVGTTVENDFKVGNSGSNPLAEENVAGEPGNPSVIAGDMLRQFHFIFLIRHPRSSIPSYHRCSVPPLVEMTKWHEFYPSEAGYKELRTLFDYLRTSGQIGPAIAGRSADPGTTSDLHARNVDICLVDADDLLDKPKETIEEVCRSVGLQFSPAMLSWETEEEQKYAREAFKDWFGWHEDVLNSTGLKARSHPKKVQSEEEEDAEWRNKYGEEAARMIRNTVNTNVEDYEYLRRFALKV